MLGACREGPTCSVLQLLLSTSTILALPTHRPAPHVERPQHRAAQDCRGLQRTCGVGVAAALGNHGEPARSSTARGGPACRARSPWPHRAPDGASARLPTAPEGSEAVLEARALRPAHAASLLAARHCRRAVAAGGAPQRSPAALNCRVQVKIQPPELKGMMDKKLSGEHQRVMRRACGRPGRPQPRRFRPSAARASLPPPTTSPTQPRPASPTRSQAEREPARDGGAARV